MVQLPWQNGPLLRLQEPWTASLQNEQPSARTQLNVWHPLPPAGYEGHLDTLQNAASLQHYVDRTPPAEYLDPRIDTELGSWTVLPQLQNRWWWRLFISDTFMTRDDLVNGIDQSLRDIVVNDPRIFFALQQHIQAPTTQPAESVHLCVAYGTHIEQRKPKEWEMSTDLCYTIHLENVQYGPVKHIEPMRDRIVLMPTIVGGVQLQPAQYKKKAEIMLQSAPGGTILVADPPRFPAIEHIGFVNNPQLQGKVPLLFLSWYATYAAYVGVLRETLFRLVVEHLAIKGTNSQLKQVQNPFPKDPPHPDVEGWGATCQWFCVYGKPTLGMTVAKLAEKINKSRDTTAKKVNGYRSKHNIYVQQKQWRKQ